MKGKMIGVIILAILALAFSIWCVVDGIYYLGAFGLVIFGSQVYDYISIKRKIRS